MRLLALLLLVPLMAACGDSAAQPEPTSWLQLVNDNLGNVFLVVVLVAIFWGRSS